MPSSGAYIAMRDVHWFGSTHVLVVITEAYPVPGRIWANFYKYGRLGRLAGALRGSPGAIPEHMLRPVFTDAKIAHSMRVYLNQERTVLAF